MDEFSDVGFMFGLTTATEEAGSFERRLTDQVDGLVEILARMLCATSKVYIPFKVTDRQRIALYKCLERHCRAQAKAIGSADWVFDDDEAMAEMQQPAPNADIPVHDEEEALPF
jgi:hypothetical protein